jgi:hypothetical protein
MSDGIGGVVPWVALLVCVAGALAAPVTATTAGTAPGDPLHGDVETDEIAIEVDVRADGNATWRIEYRTELGADGNTTDAFESLAADVRANPDNYTDRFADRIRTTVRGAENDTGRAMTATDFAVETETSPIYGIVTYSFEWSRFANVTDDRVVVGDAIAGFVMNADTQLRVRWPANWTAATVSPSPDATAGRSVLWDGASTEFAPDQPRVVLEPVPATATPTPTGTPANTDATPTDPGDTTAGGDPASGGNPPILAIAVLALAAAGVGIAWWRRPTGPGDGDAGGAPVRPDAGSPADGPADGDATGGSSDGGSTPDGSDATTAAAGGRDEDVDEELLSNEERVLRVLGNNGGRARQQEVVEELGWTEAKTSQVVSGMREEGIIDGFRLGRENVLTLPDVDPTDDADDGGT